MHRRLALGATAAAFTAFGGHAAHSASQQNNTAVKLDRKNAQLRLVQVVFRHGARTPLTDASYLWQGQEWNVGGRAFEPVPLQLVDIHGGPAPLNEHDQKQMSTQLAGGTSKGELTKIGQLQALELGYWLRQQYIDTYSFLPASHKPGVLAARTTNFSRTRATMAGVLTGLYPGSGPIPVTTSGDLDEILYADTKRCPHLKVLMKASEAALKARWEHPSRVEGIRELQQQLDKLLNLPEGAWERRWMLTDIHDALTSLAAHGKELPQGLTPEMRDKVDLLATEEISAFICPALVDEHGHAVLRLSMGRLLDILLSNMEEAAAPAGQQQQHHSAGVTADSSHRSGAHSSSSSSSSSTLQQPKLMLYSGHDSTIMPLLTALGRDLERWPPYISNLAFELWELKPPSYTPQNNMAPRNRSSSSSSYTANGSAASDTPGPFVVRVLYNKQPLPLPGAPAADPTVLDLATFKHEVLAPFILSEEQHAQACRMSISHDSAMPQPEEEEFDPLGMAPGGGAVPQPPPGTQDAAANVPQQPQPQPQGSSSSDSGAGSRRQHNGKL